MSETKYHHHGRFAVQGGTLPDAITAYRTYGDPANPCIVFPTCYGGRLDSQLYMIGEDKALDPRKYYIVTFALFSNGESSSPSNTPPPYNGPYFPAVSYEDNISAQYKVLTEVLKVRSVLCVIGFSMGGQQTYYWATMYPQYIQSFVCICGSARTSPHNKCFLEGPKAALVASRDFQFGHYTSPPEAGIRAFGRVYSAWAYGQTWYRNHGYLMDGQYKDLEDFLRGDWEGDFLSERWDANDLVTLLNTWSTGDCSKVGKVSSALQGDLSSVLGSLPMKALIMPSKTDLYFPPEDNELEVASMQPGRAELVVIPSVWGHMAGGSLNQEDVNFVKKEVQRFLASL
ncbi:hypothetical protein NM688_g2255 [Phlebia brevispora]|uniref:Uncharacterized protein n=1 Tax=Phlebia brevispora TaxID=194682 RepID=A0ACC1T965_9APHY|nr:hypothetical protein NM688_g2255 [Phlebia brevispora]